MDRANEPQIPNMQIGFFSAIVLPAFELMKGVLPETNVLFESVQANHAKWKELDESKRTYKMLKREEVEGL
jgi:hypothetical protein